MQSKNNTRSKNMFDELESSLRLFDDDDDDYPVPLPPVQHEMQKQSSVTFNSGVLDMSTFSFAAHQPTEMIHKIEMLSKKNQKTRKRNVKVEKTIEIEPERFSF